MPALTLESTATVGVLANPSGECEPQLLAIEAWAVAQGLRTVDLGTADRVGDLPEAVGLVIALGGDGTILRALQLAIVDHSPLLGVNFGHLGFLADVDGDDLGQALDRIARGDAQIDERTVLVATSQTPVSQTVVAFNDLVISRRPGFGSARLHVEVSGEPVLDLTAGGAGNAAAVDGPGRWRHGPYRGGSTKRAARSRGRRAHAAGDADAGDCRRRHRAGQGPAGPDTSANVLRGSRQRLKALADAAGRRRRPASGRSHAPAPDRKTALSRLGRLTTGACPRGVPPSVIEPVELAMG